MLAIGGAGLAWRLLRGPEAKPGGRPRRWLLASLLVGLVCWSAPLLDQVVHRPGNLVALERTARAHQPTVGPASGWRAAVRAVGVPAWWQRRARPPFERYLDTAKDPGALSIATFAIARGRPGRCSDRRGAAAPRGGLRRRARARTDRLPGCRDRGHAQGEGPHPLLHTVVGGAGRHVCLDRAGDLRGGAATRSGLGPGRRAPQGVCLDPRRPFPSPVSAWSWPPGARLVPTSPLTPRDLPSRRRER